MRYSVLQLLAILSLGLLTACSSDLDSGHHEEIPFDSRAIELSYELPVDKVVQTRTTESDTAQENDIQALQAFVFDEDQKLIRQFRVGDGLQTLDKSKLRLFIAEAEVSKYESRALQLVLIANYNVDLEATTLLKLQEELLNSNFNEDNPSVFVMTGSLELNQIRWGEGNPVLEVQDRLKLIRVASKFQFQISDIDVYDETNNTKVHYELVGSPSIRFINYSTFSSLLPTSSMSEFTLSSTEYIEMVNSDAGYVLPQAYYSYESDWSAAKGYDVNREAHLMLKLVFKAKNSSGVYGDEKEYFYQIPINYRFPTAGMSKEEIASLHKIQRNHLYRIVSSIHQLGSEDEGEPFNLSSEISVAPWVNHDIDGNIDTAHFLMVKEKNPMMPNVNRIRLDYQSSLPITITNIRTEFTSYDKNGVAHKYNENNPKSLRLGFDENLKYIDIVNPIPTNFVPLDIYFTVRHRSGSNLSQEVHVVQYPPKYVTATKSTGYVNSTPTNPYADFRFHDLLGCNGQNNSLFYKITTLVNTDREIIGDPTGTNGSTKTDLESSRIISPQFIIASQHGLSMSIPQYRGGNPSSDWYNYTLGLGPNGSVFKDDPEYYKANYPYNQGFAYYSYGNAGERCRDYFEGEYGTDGEYTEYYLKPQRGYPYIAESRKVNKKFKYQGKWRIPTLAELEYIDNIQDDTQSVVKSLLWGNFYWSAQEDMAYNFTEDKISGQNEANVRCVFDTWKLKNHE